MASPWIDCRLTAEVGSGADDRGIAVAPIMSVAGEDTHSATLHDYEGAVAIMFDFMDPVLALGRLVHQEVSWGSMNLSRAVTRKHSAL